MDFVAGRECVGRKRLCCSCLVCQFVRVSRYHWWKEGDWMVMALEPPLLGSITEGTWAREGMGRWVCGGSSRYHTCTVYSMTEEVRGWGCKYKWILHALMHIIIRYGLISYQSHSNGIMSSQGNKTQQGLSTDHTTSEIRKHKGS